MQLVRRSPSTKKVNRHARPRTALGRYGKIFINQDDGNEAPRVWPDETARCGAVGQSAAGTDVAGDVTEGRLTVRASTDVLS
jgi:hypothetical protein